MQTVQDLLDALRDRAGSDRKASVLVGVTQGSFSEWRRGHGLPDDESARAIAEELQLELPHVLAVIHGARAKSKQTRAAWRQIAEQFGKAASLAVVAIGMGALPSPAEAAPLLGNSGSSVQTLCIMSTRRRRQLAALAALASRAIGVETHRLA